MKIATWNVNSLRVRLPHVIDWLKKENPDVLGLQELKMENKNFPVDDFKNIGYDVSYNGQKTYNGVAVISRHPIIEIDMPDKDEQKRILAATIQGVRVINVYVPNGESVGSPKYQYKLNWLEDLKNYLVASLKKYPQLIIMGDFNIAPKDEDVYDPKAWEGKVLCSEAERKLWEEIRALGLIDSFRLFPQDPQSYSWWDYRMAGFRRNLGLRIDHILVSEPLKESCESCVIDKGPRGLERPSDHTPVVLTLGIV